MLDQDKLTEIINLMKENQEKLSSEMVTIGPEILKNIELIDFCEAVIQKAPDMSFIAGFYIGKLYAETFDAPKNSKSN